MNELLDWLHLCRKSARLEVRHIRHEALTEWHLDAAGVLVHRSRRFFAIAKVSRRIGGEWQSQPIILQPEIGILGFAARTGVSGNELLLQAKTEPGNHGGTQFAPSVQATESNFERVHGGRPTPLLAEFRRPDRAAVLCDLLQSEQGSRFFGKYNRNVMLLLPHAQVDGKNWRWTAIEQILPLLWVDHCVNTDARSVLVCAPWSFLCGDRAPFTLAVDVWSRSLAQSFASRDPHRLTAARDTLEQLRKDSLPSVGEIAGLPECHEWTRFSRGWRDRHRARFDICLVAVSVRDREVGAWQQPLFTACGPSRIVMLVQVRAGELRIMLRARAQIGFREGWQYGPSLMSEFDASRDRLWQAGVQDRGRLRARVCQSDEGGRFGWTECNYEIRELEAHCALPNDPTQVWLSLGECLDLVQTPGLVDNEARSCLSLFLPWLLHPPQASA